MIRVSYEDVVSSLKNMGICNGDLVFITADLLQVGYFPGSKSKTYLKWLEILQNEENILEQKSLHNYNLNNLCIIII